MTLINERLLEWLKSGGDMNRSVLVSVIEGALHFSLCESSTRDEILHCRKCVPLCSCVFEKELDLVLEAAIREIEEERSNPTIIKIKDGLCCCSCADKCPLGKAGMDHRCTMVELFQCGCEDGAVLLSSQRG